MLTVALWSLGIAVLVVGSLYVGVLGLFYWGMARDDGYAGGDE
jgi:hypothetical protein